MVAGKAYGVLTLTFAEMRTFDETEKDFISSLVHQCAQVIERARLNEARQEIALYRIVQESMNNISKHSQATEASISITTHSGQLELRIHDNGQGFDPENTSAGHGLGGMRERATLIGATIDIVSQPGQGTEVIVIATMPPPR
jgi:signal transduction histidine kinase